MRKAAGDANQTHRGHESQRRSAQAELLRLSSVTQGGRTEVTATPLAGNINIISVEKGER